MQDMEKTKEQLTSEVEELRERVARLEGRDAEARRPDRQLVCQYIIEYRRDGGILLV